MPWKLAQRRSDVAEISSIRMERLPEVSALAAEMREAVIELGEQRPGEKGARFLERAARAAGISFRAAKSLFYCEAQNPSARVVDSVRAARDRRRASSAQRDRQIEEQARARYQRSTATISNMLATASVSDTDEIRDLLVELIGRLDRLCGMDRPVDQREAA